MIINERIKVGFIYGSLAEDAFLTITNLQLVILIEANRQFRFPLNLFLTASLSKSNQTNVITVLLKTKRFSQVTLIFDSALGKYAEKVIKRLADSSYNNPLAMAKLFKNSAIDSEFPVDLLKKEYLRQMNGDKTKYLELTNINEDYKFTPTYPRYLIIPISYNRSNLKKLAEFRFNARIPAMSYYLKEESTLWRSSQPRPSLFGKSVIEDVSFLDAISYPSNKLEIFDCRSYQAAFANRIKGGGYENEADYHRCKLHFCDIPNIHKVKESYASLFTACNNKDDNFLEAAAASSWLQTIKLIMAAAVKVKESLLSKSTVLIHCSDGWDRTAQVSALSQLLIDPYFRTIDGFAVLVEKEFCEFGHPFGLRTGISKEEVSENYSPIFIQFLDCVHQVMFQFPRAFEFNVDLLVYLAEQNELGMFGNFLLDCPKEREIYGVYKWTCNIWKVIEKNKDTKFVNVLYEKFGLLSPNFRMFDLRLWYEHFTKEDEVAHKNVFEWYKPEQKIQKEKSEGKKKGKKLSIKEDHFL